MDNFNYSEIGRRLKALRKRKGLNQQELAELLGKSLRTVQKYETGEIEVSIAIVNQLAEILESTPTYILGYEVKNEPITNLADIMNLLFQLERYRDWISGSRSKNHRATTGGNAPFPSTEKTRTRTTMPICVCSSSNGKNSGTIFVPTTVLPHPIGNGRNRPLRIMPPHPLTVRSRKTSVKKNDAKDGRRTWKACTRIRKEKRKPRHRKERVKSIIFRIFNAPSPICTLEIPYLLRKGA